MKIVHAADLHIGLESQGPIDPHTGLPRRLEDFLRSLELIVDTAIGEEADLVLFAGDIYKNREPTPTHQRAFAKQVLRLVQAHIPTVLLAGNHDLPNAVSRATSIDIFSVLEVGGVVVGRSATTHRIETKSGPVLVSCLPWVTRAALLSVEAYRDRHGEELEQAFAELISKSVKDLAEDASALREDPELRDAPCILLAHLHAQEATDGAERLLTIGTDPLVPVSWIATPPFDYVALGHIHRHQELCKKPPVVYPGSIERVSFGEDKESKGFVVAEVVRDHATWHFEKLPARNFVTIDVEATDGDPTEASLTAIENRRAEIVDAVVRVRIALSSHNQALLDEGRIRIALADAFWVAQIYRNVDRPIRTSVAGMSVEGKSPLDLLDDYLFEKKVPEDERKRLHDYAVGLLTAGLAT